MVGRVSYLGRVKQGNYNTHVLYTIPKPKLQISQTISFHNNLPYPPPYYGYPGWERVTLCRYQHYPTLDTYLSLSFHSYTLPEYLFYPSNRRKNTPSLHVPHLPHPRHLSVHTCNYLTIPSITYPNLHFLPYTIARA